MLITLLILAAALAVLFAAGTASAQGFWYENVTEGVVWRAPLAAVAVAGFFAGWMALERNVPGQFDTLFNFSAQDTTVFEKLWSERAAGEQKQEFLYQRRADPQGRVVYERADDGRPWRRNDSGMMSAIIVEENGQRVRFEVEKNADGSFKQTNDGARYVEVGGRGRVMTENALGRVSASRGGMVLLNVLFNLLHFAVWLLALAVVLRFQWPHALMLAAVLWLAASVLLWPLLQDRVGKLPKPTVAAPATA